MTATTDFHRAQTRRPSRRRPGAMHRRPEVEPLASSTAHRTAVAIFTGVPMLALVAAIPVAWIWGFLNWQTVLVGIVVLPVVRARDRDGLPSLLHPRLVQGNRAFKIVLGVAGSLAIEGPILDWVSDHRRHHKYSDKEGDPHSPWRFGDDCKALTKGLVWAHMGWLFDRDVHLTPEVLPGLAGRRRHRRGEQAVPRPGRRDPARPGPDRRALDDVLAGRA